MKNQYFRRTIYSLFLTFFVFLATVVGANAQQNKMSPGQAAALQTALNNLRNAHNVKGISAAVYSPKHGLWKGVTGVSHGTVPIDTTMLFGMGSITKTYVAAEIFKLIDANQLRLTDSVHSLIRPYQHVNPNITVAQLLGHKSGLDDVTSPAWQHSMLTNPNKTRYIPQVLDSFLTAPVALPGAPFNYSNANYVLLGAIIEAKKTDSLHKVLRQDLLQPNGLANTHMEIFENYPNATPHNWSTPSMNPALAQDVSHIPRTALWSSSSADGGYFSDAADLATWGYKLYSGKVLSAGSLSQMVNFTPVSGGYMTGYGLGAMRFPAGVYTFWGHAGNYFGYAACMLYYPQDSVAVGMVINQDCIAAIPARGLLITALRTLTGIGKDIRQPVYSIFPNPANEKLTLVFPANSRKTTLQLYDLTGKLLLETGSRENELVLNTAPFPNGMYLLKVITDSGTAAEKIVIRH